MSNHALVPDVERCTAAPNARPTLEALPGRLSALGGLPIRRLLPRSQRRLVGPWCFLDAYGPLTFAAGKPMDVAPHPHIGLQTVSWLLAGQVLHHDSLGCAGRAEPGVLNLMTAGRGIAHSEETPPGSAGQLHGVQLWVALPEATRAGAPAFDQHRALPGAALDGGHVTVLMGQCAGLRSPARAFSPLVALEVALSASGTLVLPLDFEFEHAVLVLSGTCVLETRPLAGDALYYLGCGRRELRLTCAHEPARLLLLGGAPFDETILMWWNFVARSTDEIVAAREDWQSGSRFGDVAAYTGARLPAPAFVARPVPR